MKSLSRLPSILKKWLLLSLLGLLGPYTWGQAIIYETYKQEALSLLQSTKQDSFDADTEAIIDTVIQLLGEDLTAVELLKQMTLSMSEVNVGIYRFPLEVGEITGKMFEAKLKEDLPPEDLKEMIEYYSVQMVNQAAMLIVQNKRYEAFQIYFQALEKLEPYQDTVATILVLQELGVGQYNQDEYEKAGNSWIEALKLEQNHSETDSSSLAYLYTLISASQMAREAYDTARIYVAAGLKLARARKDSLSIARSLNTQAAIEELQQNWEAVYVLGKESLQAFDAVNEPYRHADLLFILFRNCSKLGYWEEAAHYLQRMEKVSSLNPRPVHRRNILEAKYLLALHEGDDQDALKYHQGYVSLKDSIEDIKNVRSLLDQQYQYEYAQKSFQDSLAVEKANAVEQVRLENQVRTRGFGFLGMLILAIAVTWIAFVQYRYRKQKQKLAKEIQVKNQKLESTLDTLKSTQDQLLIQEKMASLGQMTAGIAHEIKNPLNFINNFSIVAEELAGEVEEELESYLESKTSDDLGLLMETVEGLKENTGYIREHGERATEIVRGMMNHARDTKGERVPTEINLLLVDAIQLAYMSFQALQPSFQMKVDKKVEEGLPLMTLNRQEIQRVIINLVGNACSAMFQKSQSVGEGYNPELSIQTQQQDQQLFIRIRDNGIGISVEIKDHIFQPFFTTKPAGQGHAGLGLSISYDIITQGYQGSLMVDSVPEEYAMFLIQLPIK